MSHLVSIISDQAVPNLLFIRQFATEDSEYFFVTTQKMEDQQSTDNLIKALKLPKKKCHKILIDANDAILINQDLNGFRFPKETEYLVNITGGNKLMSQMVFSHFQQLNAKMYYAPIDSDYYQQVYPTIEKVKKEKNIKTSLDDYLRAYGYVAKSSLEYYEGNPSPQSLLHKVIKLGHPGKVDSIKKSIQKHYNEADRKYLSGEWFELYCYQFFKEAFDLDESQIACSVGIKRADSNTSFEHDNEFDVMFVYQSDLYVFECKVYPSGKLKMGLISNPMFKLASLTQNFGLKCKKYLAVIGEFPTDPKSSQQLDNIKQNLGIAKVLDIAAFSNYSGKDILRDDNEFKISQLLEKFNKT